MLKKLLFLITVLVFSYSITFAGTITSETTGGAWNDTLTWIERKIPTINDDVIINGPVSIPYIPWGAECKNLSVNSTLLLDGGMIQVNGNLINNSLIQESENSVHNFYLRGNLENFGEWDVSGIFLLQLGKEFGADPDTVFHKIKCGEGFEIASNQIIVDGNLILESDIKFSNTKIYLQDGDIILSDNSFTISGGLIDRAFISGETAEFIAENNASIKTTKFSSFVSVQTNKATVENVMLQDDCFLEVNDSLIIKNTLHIEDSLANFGEIHSLSNSGIALNGAFYNEGIFTPKLYLPDSVSQNFYLYHKFEGSIAGNSNSIANVNLLTDAEFENTRISDCNIKVGVHNLIFSGESYIGRNVKIEGEPAKTRISANSETEFYKTIFKNIILEDSVYCNSEVELEGVVENMGVLYGKFGVRDTLINHGTILSKGSFNLQGSILNMGTWEKDEYDFWLYFVGEEDQFLDMRAGGNVYPGKIIIDSKLSGTTYKWYINNVLQDNYTSSTIELDTLTFEQFGTYLCEVDGVNSRVITIGDGVIVNVEEEFDVVPNHFELSQNYPNPFNPTTNIKYILPESGNIKLTVFDILGKQIEVLANKSISAGSYQQIWDASDFSSGIYFVRIEFTSLESSKYFIDVKKMVLSK